LEAVRGPGRGQPHRRRLRPVWPLHGRRWVAGVRPSLDPPRSSSGAPKDVGIAETGSLQPVRDSDARLRGVVSSGRKRRAQSTPCSPSDHSGVRNWTLASGAAAHRLALSSRRISRSWSRGSVACSGGRGSAMLAGCGRRVAGRARALPAASGAPPRGWRSMARAASSRKSRPTSGPWAQTTCEGFRGKRVRKVCCLTTYRLPKAEDSANTLLGVKGSQVQILSSRRHRRAVLFGEGAARRRFYLRKQAVR
jgi:hypothetical protein